MSEGIWRDDEAPSQGATSGPVEESADEGLWGQNEGQANTSPGRTGEPRIEQDVWRPEESTAARAFTGMPDQKRRASRKASARRPSRIRRILVGLIVVVVMGLVGDIGYSTIRIKTVLEQAKSDLGKGAVALRSGNLTLAQESFSRAFSLSDEARRLTYHPGLVAVGSVPELGNDVRAVRALSTSAEFAAKAGSEGTQAASAMGAEGQTLASAFFLQGRVQLENIDRGRPFMDNVAQLIRQSVDLLDRVPEPHLPPIREALDDARGRTTEAEATANKASVLFAALPDLLGADSSHRYMLAFQALGEARATGGLIGLYGILDVKDGKSDLGKVESILNIFPGAAIEPVKAPPSFERSYGPQFALRQVQQVNVSPNFPVVADVLLRMYEQETGDRLDGVIAMDPITLQLMMQGMDPIDSPYLEESVSSDNAAEVLMVDSYLQFKNPEKQNEFLADLVERFWDRLNSDVEGSQTMAGFAEAVNTGHFKVFSRDPADQEALARLDADGDLSNDPNLNMVFHNNYSGNKVDYYLRRTVNTTVTLTLDGRIREETKVVIENTAPDGPASPLLGPPEDLAKKGDEPGLNRMILNFLIPEGSSPRSLRVGQKEIDPFTFQESRHLVAWDVVEIPAGESRTATLISEGPANISRSGIFTLTLQPQTMVEPDGFNLKIVAPSGFMLVQADRLTVQPASTFEASGVLDEPRAFSLQLVSR